MLPTTVAIDSRISQSLLEGPAPTSPLTFTYIRRCGNGKICGFSLVTHGHTEWPKKQSNGGGPENTIGLNQHRTTTKSAPNTKSLHPRTCNSVGLLQSLHKLLMCAVSLHITDARVASHNRTKATIRLAS